MRQEIYIVCSYVKDFFSLSFRQSLGSADRKETQRKK